MKFLPTASGGAGGQPDGVGHVLKWGLKWVIFFILAISTQTTARCSETISKLALDGILMAGRGAPGNFDPSKEIKKLGGDAGVGFSEMQGVLQAVKKAREAGANGGIGGAILKTYYYDKARDIARGGGPRYDADLIAEGIEIIGKTDKREDAPRYNWYWTGLAAPYFYGNWPKDTEEAGRLLNLWASTGDETARCDFVTKGRELAAKKFSADALRKSFSLIAVREGVESILVLMSLGVAAVGRARKCTWTGGAVGLLGGVLLYTFAAVPAAMAGAFYKTALLATVALSWMVILSVGFFLARHLQNVAAGFLFGFLSVFREGAEITVVVQLVATGVNPAVVSEALVRGVGIAILGAGLGWVGVYFWGRGRIHSIAVGVMWVVAFSFAGYGVRMLQAGGWIASRGVDLNVPEWAGIWFGIFPTEETLIAQGCVLAIILIWVQCSVLKGKGKLALMVWGSSFFCGQSWGAEIFLPIEAKNCTMAAVRLENGWVLGTTGGGVIYGQKSWELGNPVSILHGGRGGILAITRPADAKGKGGEVWEITLSGGVTKLADSATRLSGVVENKSGLWLVEADPGRLSLNGRMLLELRSGGWAAADESGGVVLASMTGRLEVIKVDTEGKVRTKVVVDGASGASGVVCGGDYVFVTCNWVADEYKSNDDKRFFLNDWLLVRNGVLVIRGGRVVGKVPVMNGNMENAPIVSFSRVGGNLYFVTAGGEGLVVGQKELIETAERTKKAGYFAFDKHSSLPLFFSECPLDVTEDWFFTKEVFHRVGKTRVLSCTTCHPQGMADGRKWALPADGLDEKFDTKSLWGSYGAEPVMWMGGRPNAAAAVKGGLVHTKNASGMDNVDSGDVKYLLGFLKKMEQIGPAGRAPSDYAQCLVCHDGGRPDVGGVRPPALLDVRFTSPYGKKGQWETLEEAILGHQGGGGGREMEGIIKWLSNRSEDIPMPRLRAAGQAGTKQH